MYFSYWPSNPNVFPTSLHILSYSLCSWPSWDPSAWILASHFCWSAVSGSANLFSAVVALVLSVISLWFSFLSMSLAFGDVSREFPLDVMDTSECGVTGFWTKICVQHRKFVCWRDFLCWSERSASNQRSNIGRPQFLVLIFSTQQLKSRKEMLNGSKV